MLTSVGPFIAGLPAWLGVLACGLVPSLAALLVGRIITSVFTARELSESAAAGVVKFNTILNIFAVISALVLVGSWEVYNSMREAVQEEASALYLLHLIINVFREAQHTEMRAEMRAAVSAYAAAVAEIDWPHLAAGGITTQSEAAFVPLARAFLDVTPGDLVQDSLASNTSIYMQSLVEARVQRMWAPQRTLTSLIWILFLTRSVSVLSFQWFFSSGSSLVQTMMGLIVAFLIGLVMFTAIKLAFPFSGSPPRCSRTSLSSTSWDGSRKPKGRLAAP
jgi:hypothetical protein